MNKSGVFFSKRSGSACRSNVPGFMTLCVILTTFILLPTSCSEDDTFHREESHRTVRTQNRKYSSAGDTLYHNADGSVIGHYYGYYGYFSENVVFGIFIETGDNEKLACFNLSPNDIFDEPIVPEPLRLYLYGYSISVNFQYRNPSDEEFFDIEEISIGTNGMDYPIQLRMKEFKQIYITQLIKK